MATIHIPSSLRDYSDGQALVQVAAGTSLRRVFENLDKLCPGIHERLVEDDAIRPGIAVFIDDEVTAEGLIQRVPEEAEVFILPALGGG